MAMEFVNIGKLSYLTAEGITVPHCFTTRLGGVSQGHLASLNIGTHRGDSPENVRKNYEIISEALGIDPGKLVLTHQTHTDVVLRVGPEEYGAGLTAPELVECDALITNVPGTALVVFTADCTPVLLHDPVTGAVGAVHAGWRGTAAGIVAKTVRSMCEAYGCKSEHIRAAIGPNIGQCCFETDADVPQAMIAALGIAAQNHIRRNGEKYYVNLKALNMLWLQRVGVRSIEISDACTACEQDIFWSHRRHGSQRGSQGAIILCKEGTV